MSRPARPEVSDAELRAALDRVGPHIENYHENLDLISKDIKSIEQYLTDSGLRHRASVTIDHSDSFPEGEAPDELDNYSGPLYRDEELIEWGADKGERWRVMYVKTRQSGYLELCERIAIVGPSFNGPCDEVERKPLIETSAVVRLKAHKKLSKLVTAVGKLVEFQPIDAPLSDDDIPF
jgi:hypothetical protein